MENVKNATTKKPVNKKKVLYVAAECKGFMTTGGLAEVAGSLPKGIMTTDKNYAEVLKEVEAKYPDAEISPLSVYQAPGQRTKNISFRIKTWR